MNKDTIYSLKIETHLNEKKELITQYYVIFNLIEIEISKEEYYILLRRLSK